MAAPLTREAILFRQRLLRSAGLYLGKLDGWPGPKTDAAEVAFERTYLDIRASVGGFDPRSEDTLKTLQPIAQKAMRYLLRALSGHGWTVKAISGTRTYPEQAALYAQGRTAPGRRVTNAEAGESWHNFGMAIDIGAFDTAGKYVTATAAYRELGAIGREVAGVEWGGDWSSLKDFPHYQLAAGLSIKEARRRFEAGEALGIAVG